MWSAGLFGMGFLSDQPSFVVLFAIGLPAVEVGTIYIEVSTGSGRITNLLCMSQYPEFALNIPAFLDYELDLCRLNLSIDCFASVNTSE